MKSPRWKKKQKMTNAEKICREVWSETVKLRDYRCVLTGQGDIQSHHMFLLSRTPGWPVIFNVDFGVSVSRDIHNELSAHPYGELFEKVLQSIRQKSDRILNNYPDICDEGRAELILKQLNEPQRPCPIPPDFKLVKQRLRRIYKYIDKNYWTERTEDIYPAYGDAI